MATSSTLDASSTRSWIWAAIIVQGLGYLFDIFWHGVLNPGREPTTVAEMVRHLATVHLPLYVGALLVLATTAWVVTGHARSGRPGRGRTSLWPAPWCQRARRPGTPPSISSSIPTPRPWRESSRPSAT